MPEKDEEAVVRSIFEPFKSKKVTRAREGTQYLNIDWSTQGLGYWRGKSAIGGDPDFTSLRSVRYLLQYGEARCGEWTDLFLHLLLTQGISVDENRDRCAIVTDLDGRYGNKYGYVPASVEFSYFFTVKDADFTIHPQNKNRYTTKGKSHGQGNKDAQPYFADHVFVYFRSKIILDVSYGKILEGEKSNLKDYCLESFNSILLKKDSKVRFFQYEGIITRENLHYYVACSNTKILK